MVRVLEGRRPLIYAMAVIALALSAAIVRMPGLVALVVPLITGVMAVVMTVRCLGRHVSAAEQNRILWWALVSLAVHLVAGLIITNSSLALYLGGDAFTYHREAIAILRHWTSGFPMPDNRLQAGKEGFYFLLAGLYWVFGISTTAGLVMNATLSALLIPIVADSTRRLFGTASAHSVPLLALLLPGLFIWTTQLLKEACVLFLLAVALNCALRLTERVTPAALFVLAGSLAALMTFRAQVGFVVAASMLLGLTLGRGHLLGGLGTGIGAMIVVSVLVGTVGLGYRGYQAAVDTDLKQAQTVRQDLANSAQSGFAKEASIATTGEAIRFLPRGLAALLLGPFPWQLGSTRQLPALFDVVAWWYLIPFVWRGFVAGWRLVDRRLAVLLLPAAMAAVILALGTGNFGTVVRERTQVVMLLMPLIAYGLSLRYATEADETTLIAPSVLATA